MRQIIRETLHWGGTRGRWLVTTATLCLGLSAQAVCAEGRSEIGVDFGTYDTAGYEFIAEVGFEVRSRPHRWGLKFAGGVSGTEENAIWGWAGLQRDFALSPRWSVIPGFGIAVYEAGSGKDLGGPIEFRSSIEVLFAGAKRKVGLLYYHLSHAGLYDNNPGSNSLVVIVRFPGTG